LIDVGETRPKWKIWGSTPTKFCGSLNICIITPHLVAASRWTRITDLASEQIANGTRAQLGYTEAFMLVHAGKYWTEDQLKIQTIHELNTTQKKQTTQNIAKNYHGSVTFYDTRPANEVGLFCNALEPTHITDTQTNKHMY